MFALLTLVGWMSGSGSRDSGISTTSICFRVLHIFLKSSILAASSLIGVPEDSKKRWEARRSRFRAVIACLGTLCPAFEADVDCYQRVYVDKKTSLRTFPFKAKSSKNCLVSCSLFLLCRLHSSDSTGIVYPNCGIAVVSLCNFVGGPESNRSLSSGGKSMYWSPFAVLSYQVFFLNQKPISAYPAVLLYHPG